MGCNYYGFIYFSTMGCWIHLNPIPWKMNRSNTKPWMVSSFILQFPCSFHPLMLIPSTPFRSPGAAEPLHHERVVVQGDWQKQGTGGGGAIYRCPAGNCAGDILSDIEKWAEIYGIYGNIMKHLKMMNLYRCGNWSFFCAKLKITQGPFWHRLWRTPIDATTWRLMKL